MNEPIISPIWIWLIGIADGLKIMSLIISSFAFVGVAFGILGWIANDENTREIKMSKKLTLISLPLCLVFLSIAVLTPNSKTLVAMLIVNEITYERVDIAKKTLQDIRQVIKDDILFILQNAKCKVEEGGGL